MDNQAKETGIAFVTRAGRKSNPEVKQLKPTLNILPFRQESKTINVQFTTKEQAGMQRFRPEQLPETAAMIFVGMSKENKFIEVTI